jgi:hypothetical protein
MERRRFDTGGKIEASLTDYAKAAQATAAAERVAFIDLNAMSQVLYAALGPEQSAQAFAAPAGKVDKTHHNNYGAFLLARCVARGLVEAQLEVSRELLPEFRDFDPARPESPEVVAIPPSPRFTHQRPLGN